MARFAAGAWAVNLLFACWATAAYAAPAPHAPVPKPKPDLQLVDAHALSPQQVDATRELLDEALRKLPPRWSAALDRTIEVQWRDDLPVQVHGRARARRMLLRKDVLQSWMAADAADAVSAKHAALATVLHELAHFYDRTAQGGLSRDARLLDLAGWQVSPVRLGLRSGRNGFTDRSPDRYELTRPSEFVAVNLEHFLLDPGYACRRPALHGYFAQHFGTAPTAVACAQGLAYMEAPSQTQPLLALQPERVYAVDYLFAEGNRQPMSRWGHSMLRLVVCAPGRPPGPDCRLDLQHHRVLSFRAFVDDVQISSWRGLTGSYPSRLFVLPLEQVVEEYAKVELRGLQSLPLRLDEAEIAALLGRAAQLHWNYDGQYYFLSNNCAVETFKLLHDGVPRLADAGLSSITPTGLLRRLRHAGVVDDSVLDDRAEAVRLGYYFEPMSARYQAMYDVARQALVLPQAQVEAWLDLPPAQRAAWLERTDLRTGAALLLLEQAALRREELLARDELKRRFLGGSKTVARHAPDATADAPPADDPSSALRALLQLETYFNRPALLLQQPGYGLPQQAERDAAAREAGQHAAQWRQQRADLHAQARLWLPASRRDRLQGAEANLERLGAHLRRLHAAQGGLRLPSQPAVSEPATTAAEPVTPEPR